MFCIFCLFSYLNFLNFGCIALLFASCILHTSLLFSTYSCRISSSVADRAPSNPFRPGRSLTAWRVQPTSIFMTDLMESVNA
ncbi:hypothetical protein HD806DRAFT_474906, partial [Xylariaceae sp. AK1471]